MTNQSDIPASPCGDNVVITLDAVYRSTFEVIKEAYGCDDDGAMKRALLLLASVSRAKLQAREAGRNCELTTIEWPHNQPRPHISLNTNVQ